MSLSDQPILYGLQLTHHVDYARPRGVPIIAHTGTHCLTISPRQARRGVVIDM